MDGIQLTQGYIATRRRQFTFYHSDPRPQEFLVLIWSISVGWKVSQFWSHPVVLNARPLYLESSALITRPLISSMRMDEYMEFRLSSNFKVQLVAKKVVLEFPGDPPP